MCIRDRLKTALKGMSPGADDKTVEDMLKLADADGDFSVSLDEFKQLIRSGTLSSARKKSVTPAPVPMVAPISSPALAPAPAPAPVPAPINIGVAIEGETVIGGKGSPAFDPADI